MGGEENRGVGGRVGGDGALSQKQRFEIKKLTTTENMYRFPSYERSRPENCDYVPAKRQSSFAVLQ